MQSVGVISLVWEVSKDLYTYYKVIKGRDRDTKELRAQWRGLQETREAVTKALRLDGIKAEDTASVREAVRRCNEAAKEPKTAVDKIERDHPQPQKVLAKIEAMSRMAAYPFKKVTVDGVTENTKTCQYALQLVITLLGASVGISSVEQLQRIDKKIVDSMESLESAL